MSIIGRVAMFAVGLLLLVALQCSAQSFTLGAAGAVDPCSGASIAYALPQPTAAIPTLRFSSQPFSCTFIAAGGPGAYMVELDFVEPSTANPGSAADGRLFNVSLTDAWGIQAYATMQSVDLVTMGAASPAVVIARSFLVFSGDGRIRVALTTVKRSAVLSRVIIAPVAIGGLIGGS